MDQENAVKGGEPTGSPLSRKRQTKSTLAIRVRKVSKSFPGIHALRNVDFDLDTGEVHGLVGANGAGKSTLIRMLSGASQPDTGTIEVDGSPLSFDERLRNGSAGIAAIYQELTIIPGMSVLSNAFLGRTPSRMFVADRGRMQRRFKELSTWMGINVPPNVDAGTLSVADQQMIEILRAVQAEQNVLIMDEPTAPLGPYERSRLYELIARLKADGVSIIFISHDLEEVLMLCDRVSVMREGTLVETRASEQWSKDTLVKAMLGDVKPVVSAPRDMRQAPKLIEVKDLELPGKLSGISFDLHRGEILGIAGLVGAGRTELLRCLAGAEATAQGRVKIDGGDVAFPYSVRDAIQAGIVLCPEDRKRQGLILGRSALSNLMLGDFSPVSNRSILDKKKMRDRATMLATQVGFNPQRLDTETVTLSGGNQQKLILGKWVNRRPKVLLLDEPTRGIDLGAKQEIFKTVRRLSEDGMSVIIVSSDLEEVVEHSDRILVMARGSIIDTLYGDDASVERILKAIFAVEDNKKD